MLRCLSYARHAFAAPATRKAKRCSPFVAVVPDFGGKSDAVTGSAGKLTESNAVAGRGTIEVLNPNGDTGGGPFARRARASAMGVWRTPKEKEYADPEGLVGRKVRVYFDGDCTFFEAKVSDAR